LNEELKALLLDTLHITFGSDILSVDSPYDFLTIQVKKDKVVDIITHLYHHSTLQVQFLTDLTASHYPDAKEQLEVVYHLHSLQNNFRLRIKAGLPISNPEIQTLTGVFLGANWMERETYDNLGVIFKGHPNLKRILNVDDMLIFPLRKEYPLEDQTRQDKNDTMFGR
jgi:NADH-quinone oxidoreductase subunit C